MAQLLELSWSFVVGRQFFFLSLVPRWLWLCSHFVDISRIDQSSFRLWVPRKQPFSAASSSSFDFAVNDSKNLIWFRNFTLTSFSVEHMIAWERWHSLWRRSHLDCTTLSVSVCCCAVVWLRSFFGVVCPQVQLFHDSNQPNMWLLRHSKSKVLTRAH